MTEEVVRYFLIRDKRYDMPEEMTGREFRFVKQETGILAGELGEAVSRGDSDLILCLAAVAMRRAGEDVGIDDLLDLRIGVEGQLEVMEDEAPVRPTENGKAPSRPAAKRGRRPSSASTG